MQGGKKQGWLTGFSTINTLSAHLHCAVCFAHATSPPQLLCMQGRGHVWVCVQGCIAYMGCGWSCLSCGLSEQPSGDADVYNTRLLALCPSNSCACVSVARHKWCNLAGLSDNGCLTMGGHKGCGEPECLALWMGVCLLRRHTKRGVLKSMRCPRF